MYYSEKGQREKELEEKQKELEKMTQDKAASPEVKELLACMNQDPIFYHKIMLYFRELQAENPPVSKYK
jgi:hypothetical protein